MPREVAMASQITLKQVVAEAKQLASEDRLRLILRVAETLLFGSRPVVPKRLQYGEFAGARMSDETDFEIAEWRPNFQHPRIDAISNV
jgi:hypothetical protein